MELEKIEKIEGSIKNLKDKTAKIYFLVQDTKGNAKGSIAYTYQMAKVLFDKNYNVIIIHETQEYTGVNEWLGEEYMTIPHESIEGKNLSISPEDFIIIPELYGDMSRRVMKILKNFSPDIEFYSIDEAFLDLTNIKMDNVQEYILHIRKVILQWTGIPVSIGAANTKTLAKIANHVAKKNKLGVEEFITKDKTEVDEILKTFPVQEVWGIGRQLSKFFNIFYY